MYPNGCHLNILFYVCRIKESKLRTMKPKVYTHRTSAIRSLLKLYFYFHHTKTSPVSHIVHKQKKKKIKLKKKTMFD